MLSRARSLDLPRSPNLPGVLLPGQSALRTGKELLIRDSEEASSYLGARYSANHLQLIGKPADFAMELRTLPIGDLELASLRFGAEVHLRQEPSQRTLLISTQTQGWARIQTGATCRDGGTGLIVIDPMDDRVCKRFSADSRRIHVRVPFDALERKCAELLGHRLQRPLLFAPFVGGSAQQHWLNLLQVLLGHLESPISIGAAAMHRALEEMVLLTLLTEQPHNHREALLASTMSLAPRHVRRAEEYMREHATSPLTLSDIANAVGVSVRTLSDGFQRSRQQSPMQFLRDIRLNGVHAELRQAAPDTSVAAVAERWGFNHPGRFSSAYRTRFGQLPSQTLRKP